MKLMTATAEAPEFRDWLLERLSHVWLTKGEVIRGYVNLMASTPHPVSYEEVRSTLERLLA